MNNIKKIIMWQLIAILGLNIAYAWVISDKFSYMGFTCTYRIEKIFTVTLILIAMLFVNYFIKDKFIYAVWNIIYIYLFAGEMIYYQYTDNANITQPISIGMILIGLVFVSRVKKHFKPILVVKNVEFSLTMLSGILILPFIILYYKYIDIKNIFLINVYETRALFRKVSIPLTGYIMAPLVRIILPVLIVNNIEKKKMLKTLMFFCMIIYVYLCGALKSVFFGLIALLLFYPGSYHKKVITFLQGICFCTFFGVAIALGFDNVFLLDSFIRRLFFIPPYLNNVYVDYFTDNFTYLAHSAFNIGGLDNTFGPSLSMYVGEKVMRLDGFNANVGVFTEGYISFGYIGSIIFAFCICCMFLWIKMNKIDSKYFGIVFVYIYYLNTSFISTLLLTHGLFFFLIFSTLFLREDINRVNKIKT